MLGGQRLAHRDAFDETDQGDQGCGTEQGAPGLEIDGRELRGRQAGGQAADNGETGPFVEVQCPCGDCCRGNQGSRRGAHQAVAQGLAQADTLQESRQDTPRHQQESQAGTAHQQRDPVKTAKVLDEGHCQLGQGRAMHVDPQHVAQLAGDDQHGRCGDEGIDHRPAEEIGDTAEAEHAEQQQKEARQERQRSGGRDLVGGIVETERADSRGRHQRHHGDRADRQDAAGAEQGVGDQGSDRRVKTSLRRKPRQQRIGEALRDQQDGGDYARQRIRAQRRAVIGFQPAEPRQETGSAIEACVRPHRSAV